MRRCFIGSLNFDPRALVINSENGLLIDSPELAAELRQIVLEMMSSENAWHVTIDEAGRLRWDAAGASVDRQPARSSWQRVSDFFGRLLPVEDQL
jgi:putative cardiolipin synthase